MDCELLWVLQRGMLFFTVVHMSLQCRGSSLKIPFKISKIGFLNRCFGLMFDVTPEVHFTLYLMP